MANEMDAAYKGMNEGHIYGVIPEADDLEKYYRQYAEILKKYEKEICYISDKLEEIRKERVSFVEDKLPEIKQTLKKQVIDDKQIHDWTDQLFHDYMHSLDISEALLNSFYVKELAEFKVELKQKLQVGDHND